MRLLLVAALLLPPALRAQTCDSGRTALVLSGGGAKGLAHIGVLKTLDSLGIRPDLVVGTSMGSIIGALYASGYRAQEIDSIARNIGFNRAFRSYEVRAPRPLAPLHPLLVWEQRASGFELQRGTVSESEVEAMLNRALLRGNLIARGDFDRLPIPYRAVATDIRDRQTVVLAHGDLAEAVRASMSLPIIFAPIHRGDSILMDGGLSANIPVDVARELGACRVIVSDVSGSDPDSLDLASALGIMNRMVDFLFQQPPFDLDSGDVYIRPPVTHYGSLDFSPASVDSIVRLGRRAADSTLALPYRPFPPRAAPPAQFPSRVSAVEWRGARPGDERFLARTFNLTQPGPLDTASISRGLTAIASGERYRGMWLRPEGRDDFVSLQPDVTPAARRIGAASIAYSSDLGGRLWLGVMDRNLGGSSVQGTAAILLGQIRQELVLDTRLLGLRTSSLVPLASIRVAHESVRFFSTDSTHGSGEFSESVTEGYGLLGVEQGLGGRWYVTAGAFGHLWHESPSVDHGAAGLNLTVGTGAHSDDEGFNAQADWTTRYTRITAAGTGMVKAGSFRIGGTVRYGWGKDLPPQLTLPLGGPEGFPGLKYAELRGDREAMALVFVDHPILRPLSLYVEGGAGQSATGGPAVPEGRWWMGGRIGVSVDSPLGPIRFDYGATRDTHDLLTFRLGHWF
ncbi:MAG TPA: patatin-like phospholipase family protein [Gemmatimonadales bacterium]|nr:patatin-like phospholipase family protein [Gemmatimonadales bacterium]